MNPLEANTVLGFPANPPARVSDDFVVPPAALWHIQAITVFAYQRDSTTTSTMTGAYVQVWDAPPDGPAHLIFGDLTTNRLLNAEFNHLYRIFNSVLPGGGCHGVPYIPDQRRPLMEIRASVDVLLPPGTYWLDYSLTGSLANGPWVPASTAPETRQPELNSNGLQFFNDQWEELMDPGYGCSPIPFRQALPFGIEGVRLCYANCDHSTIAPVLNIADFACFLQRFASGEPYANCDGSAPPLPLNIADFACFLQAFAAGCP